MKRKIKKWILLMVVINLLGCTGGERKYIEIANSVDITVEESKTYLEKDQYLPIGTIVSVEGIQGKVMIVDTRILHERRGNEEKYDYLGTYYPRGTINLNDFVGFNESQIEVVHQLGYVNEEFLEFADSLLEYLELKNETGFQDLLSKDISQDWTTEFYDSGIPFPIGTVFEVDGQSAMIIGYNIGIIENNEIYDYSITYYPYGIISGEIRLINQEDIPRDSIRFLGYIDDSFFKMITGEK